MTEAKESREGVRWDGRDAGWLASTSSQGPRSPEKESGEMGEMLAGFHLVSGASSAVGRWEVTPRGQHSGAFKTIGRREGTKTGATGEREGCIHGQTQKTQELQRRRGNQERAVYWPAEASRVSPRGGSSEGQKAVCCSRKEQTSLECLPEANSKGPQMPKLPLSSDNPLFKLIN